MAGNYNVVRLPMECSKGGRLTSSMRRFSEIIKDLELRDLPLQGGPYMWRGGLNNQSNSRLDRFLVSENWEGHFTGVVQCVLPKPVSNHSPILSNKGDVRRDPMPFKFRKYVVEGERLQG